MIIFKKETFSFIKHKLDECNICLINLALTFIKLVIVSFLNYHYLCTLKIQYICNFPNKKSLDETN